MAQTSSEVAVKADLLYENSFADAANMDSWKMEGRAMAEIRDGWMHMQSIDEESHHVYWCAETFPSDFIAEWEVQNHHPEAGLCIIFFAGAGINGEDLFDTLLKPRNGIFKQYTKGDLNNYHISYYANTPTQKDRPFSHLRKNKGFKKVQIGKPGIPSSSTAIHKLRLIKNNGCIQLFLDDKSIINWTDGHPLGAGKIGFRQMKWTQFAYRNFKVWSVKQ
ncbi:YesU family protein [Flavobacteriales bacterium]|nr:YesU family protein [Flavobacteriales bacterium]